MKVILTKTFINDFEKQFKKYWINHNNLVLKLKQTKVINLQNPYFKIKTQINWVDLRWLWIFNAEKSLIPLFFVLKKDKKYWENLILNKEILEKVNNIFSKFSLDFEKWTISYFL